MKNNKIYSSRVTNQIKRATGEKILFLCSALLSLGFVMYFLISLATTHVFATGNALPAVSQQSGNENSSPAPESVSDIVTKALAFKALLTTTQQATLEQTYTTTLARKWSNLPNQLCAPCRNGIQLGTLTSAQLGAALEVIKAAEGTGANEGSAEFNQVRLADTYLSANGGGGSYGEGIYFISFLNTPSTNGAWMLQFGGHHYAANISFNQGHVVGTTPQHEALEPLSFTANGTTYTPLAQEHDGLAAMLASLDSTQLATAKLNTTFSDCTMVPGESNGGNGTFPTTKVGVAVGGLSDAQKLLVLAAMKPWVQDMDDSVAANLLSIYQSELNSTYIAFTGTGVAGDASSFLTANTNYARIDGPSVWIEFACQGGIVVRNQIHYHTVWRDHVRDYGKDLSLTTPLDISGVVATSGASYVAGSLAPESIGSLFGTSLASSAVAATTVPLPTTLDGVQVQVKDFNGITRNAPLFYVSPTQINFQVPPNTALGSTTVNVLLNGITVGSGTFQVNSVVPGMFTFDANGSGVAAAYITRVKADGTQSSESIATYNATQKIYVPIPIDLGASTDQVYLVAFGTGVRFRTSLSAVTATIGGASVNVQYAGEQGYYVGLDQANILIPRNLSGQGVVNVALGADAKSANNVTIQIK